MHTQHLAHPARRVPEGRITSDVESDLATIPGAEGMHMVLAIYRLRKV